MSGFSVNVKNCLAKIRNYRNVILRFTCKKHYKRVQVFTKKVLSPLNIFHMLVDLK